VARNVAVFPVPPERVFAVLSDPATYPRWVVGSDAIRAIDADWPAPGSRFHHRVGIGPLKIDDDTEVLEIAPPRRLVLHARARPLITARVVFELAEDDGGTRVTMIETPGDPISHLVHNPLTDPLVAKRNQETLRRLGRLVTAEAGATQGSAGG
jgi:uncharacterized protein YndB with AHSA1/START domain